MQKLGWVVFESGIAAFGFGYALFEFLIEGSPIDITLGFMLGVFASLVAIGMSSVR